MTQPCDGLVSAVRAIAHGGVSGPTGLEMLAMAIAGVGLHEPLSASIEGAGLAVAEALQSVATSIDNLAIAVRSDGKRSPTTPNLTGAGTGGHPGHAQPADL